MLLENLKIRTKALIPLLMMALIVLAVIGFGAFQLTTLGSKSSDIINRRDRALVDVLHATRSINRLKIATFQALIYDNSENERVQKQFDDAHAMADKQLADAASLLPESRKELETISTRFDALAESAKTPLKIGLDTPGLADGAKLKPQELDKMAEGARELLKLDKASSALIDDMFTLSDKLSEQSAALAEELQATSHSAILELTLMGVLIDSRRRRHVSLDHIDENRPPVVAACGPNDGAGRRRPRH